MTKIAVLGKGGLGKTTFVSNVYRNNTVQSHFDCQAWIMISPKYSVEELLRTMINEIFKGKMESVPNNISTMTRPMLLDITQKSLQQKRFIVVLDAVWRVDLWNDISHLFVDSNNGSRVIVTTRSHEVATVANEEHIIELQRLNESDAWILFCKKAFPKENNNDCPEELRNYARLILDNCQGSPLAIAVIGSLLSFKEKSESEWKKVHDQLRLELGRDPVSRIINLSFSNIPYYLTNCFVYCSIFPENYLIKRKKLIRLWVAEGFVKARSNNRSMEEVAEDYLAELVDRSMLQVVQRNDFGRLKAFRMHDLVREATLVISKKMKFCMIHDGSQSNNWDNPFRRLSIQTDDESLDLSTNLPQLRSLITFGIFNSRLCFRKAGLSTFRMLRVLELEGCLISNLPNEVLALFNLHYLGLRYTKVKQLPDDIQKLQSLQTLDLRDSNIVKLRHGVTQMKQLRHLFASDSKVESGQTVGGCFPTLEGAWQWKNLQTLHGVEANKKLLQQLGDMKELRSLKVVEVQQAHCLQFCISLINMRNLHRLLSSARSKEQLNFEMLYSPPPPLQKLELRGRLFEGRMPRFISSCAELTHVRLFRSQLTEDPLSPLGQLPKLVKLTLGINAFDGQKLHFKTGWFLNLKMLYLGGLENLTGIVIEEGTMVNLRELFMDDLRELKMIPCGIEFLTRIQDFYLFCMSEELVGSLRNFYDNEVQRRIRHIPRISIKEL